MGREKIISLKTNKIEKEKNLKISLDLITNKAKSEDEEFQDKTKSEVVENIIKEYNLPLEMQKVVQADYDRLSAYRVSQNELNIFEANLKKQGLDQEAINILLTAIKDLPVSEELIKNETQINANRMRASYQDRRFNMSNKPFAKLQIIDIIDKIVRSNPTINDLKRVARISFDLNGLKPVNDITKSHEKGDDYLRIVANALQDKKVKQWLKDANINIIATADGGDEFGVILEDQDEEGELSPAILGEFIDIMMNTVKSNNDAAKILDFDQDETLIAFEGISEKEWEEKNPEEKRKILDDLRKQIPSGYKFRAEVSAGAVTLYDSLDQADIKDDDSYHRSLEKIMGSIFDLSDKEMQKYKEAFKSELKTSDNPMDKMLALIYSRTEAERKLIKIEHLNKIIRDKKSELIQLQDDIITALEGGLEVSGKTINKRKEIKAEIVNLENELEQL